MGKVATQPLPLRRSPPLQSGGQNQNLPTCCQGGYATPAASGIPSASERGQIQKWPTCGQGGYASPAASGIPIASEHGGRLRSGPLVGKVATQPLPLQGSPPFQSGGQIHHWPTCGQGGYATPAASGIPTASEQGAESEAAHLWARCLRNPCRLGDPHRLRAGGRLRSGPLVGKVATQPLLLQRSPPLQSGGQNQNLPTCGQGGYATPAASGIPSASEWGGIQKWPTCGQGGYATPAASGIPSASERGADSEVAHLWARWLRNPCRLKDPHNFRAGGRITIGPLVGKVATQPLPSWGSPPPQSGG